MEYKISDLVMLNLTPKIRKKINRKMVHPVLFQNSMVLLKVFEKLIIGEDLRT